MIKELTENQKKQLPLYLKKWLDVGYRTEAIDREKAKESVNFIYTDILNIDKPKYYIFLDSPMACLLGINLLQNINFSTGSQLSSQLDSQLHSQLGSQLGSQLSSQLYSQLHSQLSSQLSSQLDSQLDSQLYSQLGSQLSSQLDSQLYSQLSSQLYSQLHSQLSSQLSSQLDSQLGSQLYSQLGSQLSSQLDSQLRSQLGSEFFYDSCSNINPRWYYFWSYDFILNEIFKEKKKEFTKYNKYMDSLQNIHLTYMFEDIVFFSNFPERIKLDKDNKLHSADSYALKYRDNYGLFSVHGELKNTKKVKATDLAKYMYPDSIVDGDYIIMMED
jgi:hypothetical protein